MIPWGGRRFQLKSTGGISDLKAHMSNKKCEWHIQGSFPKAHVYQLHQLSIHFITPDIVKMIPWGGRHFQLKSTAGGISKLKEHKSNLKGTSNACLRIYFKDSCMSSPLIVYPLL